MSRFHKWFFCIIAACFLIGCASTSDREAQVATRAPTDAQVAQGGTPVAELAEMGIDFGAVNPDSNLTHDFKVKNTGDGVLAIKKVLPG